MSNGALCVIFEKKELRQSKVDHFYVNWQRASNSMRQKQNGQDTKKNRKKLTSREQSQLRETNGGPGIEGWVQDF